ncbi:hypothetical protein KQI42_20060 [Tissierella sp. MSJ-40]|uniref:Uncharacterized protein n=1 Tax=Tissierella simiarum TaxID=2841534 RepID=A0ABS6EBJ5_9FIRM|nr:hypothetical protein [Tissierella simiarum]MBU5440293.1 hypothetical protein [Tissierella simiarum]
MSKIKKDEEVIKDHTYSKRQFIQSDMYSIMDRDVLKIILNDDKKYTKEEVNSMLKDFKTKEVK